jgi:AraC-like DNA-binding protein
VFIRGTINKSDRKTVLIQQFNELVNVKFKQWKFPRQYADELHITSNYLNMIVKKSLGWSAGYIIRERIVLEAKRLLQSTDLTVAEIGTELGFTDKSNFNKYFKGYVHTTRKITESRHFSRKINCIFMKNFIEIKIIHIVLSCLKRYDIFVQCGQYLKSNAAPFN